MKFTISLLCLAFLSSLYAQDGWKRPTLVSAKVTETFKGRAPVSYRVTQYGDWIKVQTTQGIGGELEGVNRVEILGPNGCYTWIEGKNNAAMYLIIPTVFDAREYFARPRFSRADLEFNTKGMEKALGKKVLVGKEEELGGRECLVLNVLDKPNSYNRDYQKLWIDKQTGIVVRQSDYFGGELTYDRELSEFEFAATTDLAIFKPAEGAIIIRGLVSPSVLTRISTLRGPTDFKRDVDEINKTLAENAWAASFDVNAPYGYLRSYKRQITQTSLTYGASGSQTNDQTSLRRQNFLAEDVTFQLRISNSGEGQTDTAERRAFFVQRGQDGQILVTAETSLAPPPPQIEARPGSGSDSSNRTGNQRADIIQSDFVDPKTGNTLTLFQAKGRDAINSLSALLLGKPEVIEDTNLSDVRYYQVNIPITVNVLAWKLKDISYALVSTELDKSPLIELAKKIKQPGT